MKVDLNKNRLGGALLSVLSMVVLIVVMDLCLGGASAWFYHRSKYGIFHRQQYILNESKDDIIILGSSRASHHYVPGIISDSLGMSCYNAGSEGMCIYYHYAMLASMIERGHCPKIVIYDVMNFDAIDYPGPTFTLDAALDRLAPHYGEYASIDSLFGLKDWKIKLKLYSKAYRYNSKLVQSIKCNFIPMSEDNGYEAVYGHLPDDVKFEKREYDTCHLDKHRLKYLQKLIDLTKNNNIRLVLVFSPNYVCEPSSAYDAIKDVAVRNGVDVIDCNNDSNLLKRDYFRDVMHLNDGGARIWSCYFAHLFKSKFVVY